MKNLLIIVCALFIAQSAVAQTDKQIINPKQNAKITPAKQMQNTPTFVLLKPDLTISSIEQHLNTTPRTFEIKVENIGNLDSKACKVKVMYAWRIDHESFSNRTKEVFYDVPVLKTKGNGAYLRTIIVVIPDNQISSNEGYGSNTMSIHTFVDAEDVNKELNEQNNKPDYFQVPIKRD